LLHAHPPQRSHEVSPRHLRCFATSLLRSPHLPAAGRTRPTGSDRTGPDRPDRGVETQCLTGRVGEWPEWGTGALQLSDLSHSLTPSVTGRCGELNEKCSSQSPSGARRSE
jgi:hypothetical protein